MSNQPRILGQDAIATESERIAAGDAANPLSTLPREIDGRSGPEPTRYGDWEKNGRCIDF